MDADNVPFLLVTANVGSVFEDPSRLLAAWIAEFLAKVALLKPQFIALHLQEVGGKTYEKSMEYVQEFIKQLCESPELETYSRIRIYLDEDYTSAEHFTALGNLYFVEKSLSGVKIWNFLTHEWESADGKSIHTGNIEAVATKEKAKFPQNFFPECRWSRKGFLRTRWEVNGTICDMVNIHLFHDASNLTASEESPSVYCKIRRRALVYTLERFHKDGSNGLAPYFVFGDFNFRCDTKAVVKKLSSDLSIHRILNVKNDHYKVQYRNTEGKSILTIGKKEFQHADHQTKFRESWLQQFDCELQPLREVLVEYPITFPPSYPYEEDPLQPQHYMLTRCPAWCDRIFMSPAAKDLIYDDNFSSFHYNTIGDDTCMGDHKPVFLSINLKAFQGTIRCCCEHVKHNNYNHSQHEQRPAHAQLDVPNEPVLVDVSIAPYPLNHLLCPYSSKEFCDVLADCKQMDRTFVVPLHDDLRHPGSAQKANTYHFYRAGECCTSTALAPAPQQPQAPGHPNAAAAASVSVSAPPISIHVIDAENLNVCMCSLYASCETVEQESVIGTICPRCQNIIKQQPSGHRKTLISKRLALTKDIIVNRVDTHMLTLKPFQDSKGYEPYTPESIESHSPLPEPSHLEYEAADECTADSDTTTATDDHIIDPFDMKCHRGTAVHPPLPTKPLLANSTAVSPQQLKTRLEILRKTSTDASGMVLSSHITETRKNRLKRGFCFNRCCVIL